MILQQQYTSDQVREFYKYVESLVGDTYCGTDYVYGQGGSRPSLIKIVIAPVYDVLIVNHIYSEVGLVPGCVWTRKTFTGEQTNLGSVSFTRVEYHLNLAEGDCHGDE